MTEERFPDWQNIYKEVPVEEMGWFHPELDPELKEELNNRGISTGNFLDLGTGSGNHAEKLRVLGFTVTGSDISQRAIELAREKYPQVIFAQDDILSTQLPGAYDYIFDRGCFHIFKGDDTIRYVENVHALLRPDGIFFLKCFSDEEPEVGSGPYRQSQQMIEDVFSGLFDLENFKRTVYQGSREGGQNPKAWFVAMRKK